MVGRLRVKEVMVLTSGGVPIFHYSPTGTRRLDELLSGFLTAITGFAVEFGERSVESLSFEGSDLIYDQSDPDLLFIFLAESGANKRVLRKVISELRQRFIERYKGKVNLDVPVEESFYDFKGEVIRTFDFYEDVLAATLKLSAFIVPELYTVALQFAKEKGDFLDEFHREFGNPGEKILDSIDGKLSVYELGENLSLEEDIVLEIIEYLAVWGLLKISTMNPLIQQNDTRFDAFLDIVGLPSNDYQLLSRAKTLCDGKHYILDISEKLGETSKKLYEVLKKLGDQVQWNLIEVTGLTRKSSKENKSAKV
jgi:hypothetical protein